MRIQIGVLSLAGVFAATSIAGAAIDDKKATEIMTKAGCTVCHSVDKTIIGPSYAAVAQKRKTEKDAAAVITKKIRDGGTGVYGPMPMPPNPVAKITDADLKALVEWVLTK